MKEKLKIVFVLLVLICSVETCAYAQANALVVDTVNDGENIIENSDALEGFYQTLKSQLENPKQINILHLGDSHIEMGYFVEEARKCFKANFGLAGFGSVFPYQLAKSIPYFVQTKTTKGIWEGKCYLKSESDFKYGMAGFTIKTTNKDAEFEIQVVKCDSTIVGGNKIVIYYSCDEVSSITIKGINYLLDSTNSINAIDFETEVIEGANFNFRKTTFYFDQLVNKIIVSVNQSADSLPFYISGLQILNHEKPGVVYHNCGVVGATFKQLSLNASLSIAQMKDVNPDLILFSYGSNEAYEPSFNENDYYLSVSDYIQRVKNAMPNASILITTPPDTRANGRFPINNLDICRVLKKVAQEQHTALWDLHEQMGGSSSMIKWFNKGLASKDKLHFKKAGYELQAQMFMYALFNHYNQSVDINSDLIVPNYTTDFKN